VLAHLTGFFAGHGVRCCIWKPGRTQIRSALTQLLAGASTLAYCWAMLWA